MKSITVGWFEIPVKDMDRAINFYQNVFFCELSRQKMGDVDMAWFPWDETGQGAGGSLVHYPAEYTPSHHGTLVYFSTEDVDVEISRVEEAGGKLLQEKTEIAPDIGFMGIFEDSEGNRIALHSKK